MGENGLSEKVKQAITSNTTVKGLMRDLQDAGMNVKNELETIVLAEDYWIKINDIERGPLENYKVSELKELPFTSVTNDGIEYRIHGITHDKHKLSMATKSFIKECTLKFSNPEKREECLFEDDLPKIFSVENANEITNFRMGYFLNRYFKLLADRGKLRYLKKKITKKICRQMWKNYEKLFDMHDKTSRDIEYLPLLRETYRRRQFPMPMELQKEELESTLYTSNHNKFDDRLNNYLFFFPSVSSEFAGHMKKFAQKNELRILHFVTGLAHEREIAYFLQRNKA